MNIHEHQAKQILQEFGAPIAKGAAITAIEQAESAVAALPGPVWVVKSQIHAGGRGKGKFKELPADAKGGVRVSFSADEALENIREIFGKTLVTQQTGPSGKAVNRIYVEDGAEIDRELYLSILVDRETGKTSFVASTEGGMDPDIMELRDETEEDEKEVEASKHDLAYIALDGEIGCMVNGAGLAMATMDIIKLYGAEPANFLDVGGSATTERVTAAFKIITADPNVKGILVNIFGGIMRCDVIATGVVQAASDISLNVPLVVRLEGTKVEEGKAIINESGLNVIAADDLDDAAQKIVKAVKG